MRYFLIALAFILAAFAGQRLVVNLASDHSKESGLRRSVKEEQTRRQAQEDKSIHHTQRQGENMTR